VSKAPVPSYSKAVRPHTDGTYEQPTHEIGGDILILGGDSKDVEVLAGDDILIEDLSDSGTDRFRVNYAPYVAMDVELTLVAKTVGVTKTNPVLKGTVIDEIELVWTVNKAPDSLALTNTGGLDVPSLADNDLAYEYASQTVSSDITFTLQGNDGDGMPGSIDSDATSISFGNNFIIGNDINRDGLSTSGLVTAITGFTKTVKINRLQTYNATGGVNNHHYVAYPKSWGLATFTKGIFTGGYVRLKNVSGVLKSVLGGGDTESDITVANALGYSEAYYVYMTLFDNQADAVTPFIIS